MKHCRNPYTDYHDWDRYTKFAATRVNSITGRKYGTDREIGFVQFSGEPREAGYLSDGTWHDGKYYTYTGAGTENGDVEDPAPSLIGARRPAGQNPALLCSIIRRPTSPNSTPTLRQHGNKLERRCLPWPAV